MQRDRRQTHIADSLISQYSVAANVIDTLRPEELDSDLDSDPDPDANSDSDYNSDSDPHNNPRTDIVTDIISKISFLASGTLSPESDRAPEITFNGADNLLQIDTEHLDGNDSEGSRSRNIAKGILALYNGRLGVETAIRSRLEMPLVTLVGTQVPFQPFLTEVSYLSSLFDLGSYAHMHSL